MPAYATARGLLVGYYALVVLLTAGLVVGAKSIVTGEVGTLLPKLECWTVSLPIAGWFGTAVSVCGLWLWRWWGFVLGLFMAAFELSVELYSGGLGWHLLRLPLAAGLLACLCLPLRRSFKTGAVTH
ncbi:MAG TPA: hypothetical protein VGC54_00040 [Planctomycetota bacterium]